MDEENSHVQTHRFLDQSERCRLPEPPGPRPTKDNFVAILWDLESLETWQLEVYCRAFEMAQAVVRPALPERDLAGVWN
jgi:hypothetical protein